MPAWICRACGVQHADTPDPPASCAICLDERQYVPPSGQSWTTADELAADHRNELREEAPDLVGIGVRPSVAIGQRALLVRTPGGNVLWDCVPLAHPDGIDEVRALGGIAAITCSHPHFYGACVDWSDAFGGAPILVPAADREWVMRPSPAVEVWSGDAVEPVPGVTVVRVGGHFPGSAVLHWAGGAAGAGALLTGDSIMVVGDRRWVSFMYSFPNLLPLPGAVSLGIADRVARLRFARIHGGWWGHSVYGGADVVRRSAERYARMLET